MQSDETPCVAPTAEPAPAPPVATTTDLLGSYLVWNPPHSAAQTPGGYCSSLPDSYFEPTAEELKAAFQSQSQLVSRLQNTPLKTQAVREREAKEKLSKWPETRIRIRFPNQLQVEKKFPSTDKIKSIYAFVRNTLTDEAKPHKFVLYEAPPRRELKVSDPEVKTKSLSQLGLAPSTVLHFSFLDEGLNSQTANPPLLPEILSKATDLPPPPSFDEPASSSSGTTKSKTTGGSSSSTPGMPKWLKLGKK